MPYGLFDYGGTINTMGGTRPGFPGNNWIQCKDGKWDVTNGVVAPCMQDRITTLMVGEEGPAPAPVPKPTPCASTYKVGNCNYRLV